MNAKAVVYFVTLLMLIGLASAATMSRSMPDRVAPGETVTVTFSVSGMDVEKTVALSEILPAGWTISDWSVSGSKEAKADITYKTKTGNEQQWSFTASTTSPSLTYTTVAPSATGSYSFDAVYMLPPASIDNLKKTVTVRVITCGDSVCEGTESSDNCAADCPPAPPATPAPTSEIEKGFSWIGVIIVIAILVLGIVAFLYFRKKK